MDTEYKTDMVLDLFCEINLPNIFAYYFSNLMSESLRINGMLWELGKMYKISRVKSNQILTDPLDGFDLSFVFQLLIYEYAVACAYIHHIL